MDNPKCSVSLLIKSSHSHLELPFKNQRYFPWTRATNRFLLFPLKGYPHCLSPHWLQSAANFELSSFILTNEPHAFGLAYVWPLKYCTTASPLLLPAVVKWKVRPLFLRQWNLNWVKDNCVLSSFMASVVSNKDLLWHLLISWYDDSSENCSKDRLPTTTLETRSQPPGKKKWNEMKLFILQNNIAFH